MPLQSPTLTNYKRIKMLLIYREKQITLKSVLESNQFCYTYVTLFTPTLRSGKMENLIDILLILPSFKNAIRRH